MVAEMHWFAVGSFSLLMTVAWMFIDRRITLTGMFATIGWSWMALTGGNITRYTESGATVALDVGELQYLCTLLALLSLLAVVMYQFDHYPPREDDPKEVTPDAR